MIASIVRKLPLHKRSNAISRGRNHISQAVNATGCFLRPFTVDVVRRTQGKDRSEEMKLLANSLNVDTDKLVQILDQQRSKMDDNTEKAKYIDWLLQQDPNSKEIPKRKVA